MRANIIASILSAALCAAAVADTVYVNPASQSPAEPYGTWASAASDLATAVGYACANGIGEVIATNGTYELSSTLVIDGGVTVRSAEGRDVTVIDGGDAVRCVSIIHADAVLSGFTITNGRTTESGGHGAGINMSAGLVEKCAITRNTANSGIGGGVYISGGTLDSSVVSYNFSNGYDGGSGAGGGVAAYYSGTIVRSCLIAGNVCSGNQGHVGGGGVFLAEGATLANCTVVGNDDTEYGNDGAGLYVAIGAAPYIVNCIIVGNHANGDNLCHDFYNRNDRGYAMSYTYTTDGSIANPPPGAPIFASAGSGYGLDFQMGDYRQPFQSPCARAGAILDWMGGANDLAGAPRVDATATDADLGAYTTIAGALACTYTPTPASGIEPLTVSFAVTTEGTEADSLSYEWDFDANGSVDLTTNTPSATFTFQDSGSFAPILTVRNTSTGASASGAIANAVVVAPSEIYVSLTGSATPPYATLETAANSIAEAQAVSADGVTILVAPGIYETKTGITIDSAITVRSIDGPETTTIDAGRICRVATITNPNAVLSGFTLANGNCGSNSGGGVGMTAGLLENCIVTNCVSQNSNGGGAAIYGGIADRCKFLFNNAQYTAGGGGVYLSGSATLRNCLVAGNECGGIQGHIGGGGVYCSGGGTIENCTITGNVDNGEGDNDGGGGLYVFAATTTVNNSIIYGNAAPKATTGPNFFAYPGQSSVVASHNCTPAPFGGDTACQTDSPLFVDPGTGAGANLTLGDYAIVLASPCARNGATLPWMDGTLDLAGLPRIDPIVNAADIGAYSLPSSPLDCSFSMDVARHNVPFTVTFKPFVSGSATNDVTFYWDFDGDGTTDLVSADTGAVTHEYATIGTFTPTLCATNSAPFAANFFVSGEKVVAAPAIVYVSTNSTPVSPYTTPETAASSPADAIAVAGEGTEVHILPGKYILDAPLRVDTPIKLVGTAGASETILDGGAATRLLEILDENAVCSGLTLTNGTILGNGGGVYMTCGTLSDCTVSGCSVTGNSHGGGASISGGVADRCRFLYNSAGTYGTLSGGGGVHLTEGGAIRNCLVAGNECSGTQGHIGGGGVYCNGVGIVENCTIVGNIDNGPGENDGGGLYVFNGDSIVVNSIMWDNIVPYAFGETSSAAEAIHDWFSWNNRAFTASNNCTSVALGENCVVDDPVFRADGTGYGLALVPGDYRLKAESPCRNMGTTLDWMEGATDLLGFQRILGQAPDIGCCECTSVAGTIFLLR